MRLVTGNQCNECSSDTAWLKARASFKKFSLGDIIWLPSVRAHHRRAHQPTLAARSRAHLQTGRPDIPSHSRAPHLHTCSRVSLVLPTWRQDNGCNPQPLSNWQCRPFVSLLSASRRSQFLELMYGTIYHLTSHLHHLSRSPGSVPIYKIIPGFKFDS